jgi:hypothetical protein
LDLVEELTRVARALDALAITYAVCGGIAVTVHGYVRATKDLDVLIRAEDCARVLEAVAPLGYNIPALPMTFAAGTDRERAIQRVTRLVEGKSMTLDLLLLAPMDGDALAHRRTFAWNGIELQVVSRETLIAMKRAAGRPQDLVDIERLERDDDAT